MLLQVERLPIWQSYSGSGSVLAWDLYKHKIDLILDNAKRLGIPNIYADVSDATVFNDKFQESLIVF